MLLSTPTRQIQCREYISFSATSVRDLRSASVWQAYVAGLRAAWRRLSSSLVYPPSCIGSFALLHCGAGSLSLSSGPTGIIIIFY